ncbi:uncharacterized protein B0T15DRAFT_402363 [Chaetomium strumarium]|uniref:NACHT-NTPase and P-loop NTPases N-terminal domain-containing protein n=1 Tax=Chaetomium strumarium TaxID=1170767 RepID=A0AAJ0GMZ2_9PEZI|nr:hypothetical protein B0T15DRAFT_402363 [Chaetomium strumarium]
MSGAELIGIISGIVSLAQASIKIYQAVDNASGLPKSFQDVFARLPLVQSTLEAAAAGIAEEEEAGDNLASDRSRAALGKVLESCRDKAAALNKILRAVMPTAGAKRMERYLKAIKTTPNADKVENLMDGILRDMQVLTVSQVVNAPIRSQMKELIAAIERMEVERTDDGSCAPAVSLYSAGSGSQYVHSGRGDQNVVAGHGVQITGKSTGPFYFGRTYA